MMQTSWLYQKKSFHLFKTVFWSFMKLYEFFYIYSDACKTCLTGSSLCFLFILAKKVIRKNRFFHYKCHEFLVYINIHKSLLAPFKILQLSKIFPKVMKQQIIVEYQINNELLGMSIFRLSNSWCTQMCTKINSLTALLYEKSTVRFSIVRACE